MSYSPNILLPGDSPIRKKPYVNKTAVQIEISSRKYGILDEDSVCDPSTSVSQNGQSTRRGLKSIELMDLNNEQENQQATHVQMDLVRGIMRMAIAKKLTAIAGLVGAFMLHLIIGAIYRWNMISRYVSVRFDEQKWAPIGAPLSMLCAGLTMRLGYSLSNSFGSRIIVSIALTIIILSNLAASYVQTFNLFLFFHNVFFGLSAGLIFLTVLKQCHSFFPNMKLITNSIILTGTGLGAVLFGAYNMECIQSDYETKELSQFQFSQLVQNNFGVCFVKMTGMMFVIGFGGIGLMAAMIAKNEQRNRMEREMSIDQRGGNFCKDQWMALTSRVFWVIGIIIFLVSCGNYYMIMNYRNLLDQQHHQKIFLYSILISGAFGNGFSRLIWGFTSSRVGFKMLFTIAAIMNIFAFIIVMTTQNEHVYLVFYTLNSISLGGLMVIFPNVSLLIFGKKIGDSIYSYYWIVFSLGNFFQFLITLILTNNPITSDDYGQVLIFFTFCSIAAITICCLQKLQGPWKNSLDLIQFKRINRAVKS